MQDRTLYSIQDSRKLLGGISRNMIYQLLRTGRLASVVIGTRRLISAEAIADLMPLRLPSSVRARIRQGGVS